MLKVALRILGNHARQSAELSLKRKSIAEPRAGRCCREHSLNPSQGFSVPAAATEIDDERSGRRPSSIPLPRIRQMQYRQRRPQLPLLFLLIEFLCVPLPKQTVGLPRLSRPSPLSFLGNQPVRCPPILV